MIFHDTQRQNELVKKDIEEIMSYKTAGAIVRCRANWHECGEKSTKYYLSRAKQLYNSKNITRIQLPNQQITNDQNEILIAEQEFFEI